MLKLRDWRRPGGLYVVTVTAVAAVAFCDPRHMQRQAEVATIVLTLPAFVALLPIVYGARRKHPHPRSHLG